MESKGRREGEERRRDGLREEKLKASDRRN